MFLFIYKEVRGLSLHLQGWGKFGPNHGIVSKHYMPERRGNYTILN